MFKKASRKNKFLDLNWKISDWNMCRRNSSLYLCTRRFRVPSWRRSRFGGTRDCSHWCSDYRGHRPSREIRAWWQATHRPLMLCAKWPAVAPTASLPTEWWCSASTHSSRRYSQASLLTSKRSARIPYRSPAKLPMCHIMISTKKTMKSSMGQLPTERW